jgi:hypothetical protein
MRSRRRLQLLDAAAGFLDHLRGRVVVEQRVEEVLDGHHVVARALRFTQRELAGDLDFGLTFTDLRTLRLRGAFQRMPVLLGVVHHQRGLGLGDVARVGADDAVALVVHVQHDCVASVSSKWKNLMSTWTTNSMVV